MQRPDANVTDLLRAASTLRTYPFIERASLWEARLQLNAAELRAFSTAPEVAAPPILTPPPLPSSAESARHDAPADGSDDPRSVIAIAAQVRARRRSAREVAEAHLERIAAHRHLNAFITVDPQRVRDEADAVDRRVTAGDDPGPLAGVPVAVKDLMSVRGYPLTGGTRAIDPEMATEDAVAVARLRAAGAVVIGTANLHELAYGINSDNPHFGRVLNPRSAAHLPGGSSGGSAAAVAAGLAAAAVGTDTAGSIRIPAACCGVVGLKPTFDAVSRDGVMTLAWSLDHVGPITRNVADAALLFAVMSARPSADRSGSRPLRVLRPANYFFDGIHREVREAVEGALHRLASSSAEIFEAPIRDIDRAPAIQLLTICPEATEFHWRRLVEHGDRLGPDVRVRLEIGQFLLAADYVKAQRLRRHLRDQILGALGQADVLIAPTLPLRVPEHDAATVELGGETVPVHPAMTRFTLPFNLTGLPAITLPCGEDRNGLPIGLQIVGRPGAEAMVLHAAARCEALTRSPPDPS